MPLDLKLRREAGDGIIITQMLFKHMRMERIPKKESVEKRGDL